MRKSLLFIAAVFMSLVSFAATTVPAGNVSGTWTKAGSPYQVQGNILVPMGSKLIIQPGATVEFMGYYTLTVEGKLNAIGATNDTILFTKTDTIGFYKTGVGDGGWAGIRITKPDTSYIEICKIRFAKRLKPGPAPTVCGGAILVQNAKYASIRNCHIHNCYAPLGGAICLFLNEKAFIENCNIHHNTADQGGAIYGEEGRGTVALCKIVSNTALVKGGGVMLYSGSNMKFHANTISFNKALATSGPGGAGIDAESATIVCENNLITNNESKTQGGGIQCNNSYPKFIGNIIANNNATMGGGINMTQSDALCINNTIYNNLVSGQGGGYLIYQSTPEFYNEIIYGNTVNQIRIEDAVSVSKFKNCIVENGLAGISIAVGGPLKGEFTNCLTASPSVITATGGKGIGFNALLANWRLNVGSPAINNGSPDTLYFNLPKKDIYLENRICNRTIDIGASEKYIKSVNISGAMTKDTIFYADTIRLTNNVTVNDNVTMTINAGSVVYSTGSYKIAVLGRLLAKGKATDSIKFTADPALPNGWEGITFDNNSGVMGDNDTSKLQYCIIEKANKTGVMNGAVLCNYFSKLLISNCNIRNNTIAATKAGGAVFCVHSSPIITNNYFTGNISDKGAAVNCEYSEALINGNIFYKNTVRASGLGGSAISGSYSNCTVSNNIISMNAGKHPVYFFGSTPKESFFINNLIVGNESVNSNGMYLTDIRFFASNNTVANDMGIFLQYTVGTLINTIVMGGNIFLSNGVQATIKNCNAEFGVMGEINNSTIEKITQMNPVFANPNGDVNSFMKAKNYWTIRDISPCINKGLNKYLFYTLPETDLLGKTRFNNDTADLGAIENMGGLPLVKKQPLNQIKCDGDTLRLECLAADTAFYKWKRDNKILGAANKYFFQADSSNNKLNGNYICIVSNAYGSIESYNAYVEVKSAPSVLTQPENMWVRDNMPLKLETTFSGSDPLTFRWIKNADTLANENKSLFQIASMKSANEGYYRCVLSNVCGAVSTDSAKVFIAPQICMVTVDSATGKNLIVWDKNTSLPVAKYNVYREGIAKGVYEKIGVVNPDKYTLFRDSLANPQKQAYWYKITTVDSAGTESDIEACIPHKTNHLLVTLGYQGGVQLDWDGYYGFPFGTYEIMRSTDGGKTFAKADFIASSNQTWSDLSTGKLGNRYFVSVVKTNPCNATMLKAESGPYAQSLSNIAEFKATGLDATNELSTSVYPNPFSESLTVDFSLDKTSDVLIEVINTTGQKTAEFSFKNLAAGNQIIHLNATVMNISEGICYIRLIAGDKTSLLKCGHVK